MSEGETRVPRRRRARALALAALVIVVLGGLGFGVYATFVMLPRATGYAAKIGCSAVFVSGLDPDRVRAEELAGVAFVDVEFDADAQRVHASAFGLADQHALRRPRLGCALVDADADPTLHLADPTPARTDAPWPLGEGEAEAEDPRDDPPGLDREALDAAITEAFADDPAAPLRTRALLVAHDGRLLAERYAEGVDARTPLPGWSMTKSLTNAIVALLVARGELELDAPAPVPEWREDPDDPRAAITLDQLLRMSSGLAFDERYGPFGAGSDMLFVDDSCAELAIDQPLVAPPGARFSYSSGTANIVARIIAQRVGGPAALVELLDRELFGPLAITSAELEFDRSGVFVASTSALMSARDWARLGQLYLDDGVWDGRRVLARGWVEYTRTPAPAAARGHYGALFQTNAGASGDPADRRLPSIPPDAFEMVGYEGQSVLIVPSRRAVLVRLGLTRPPARWDSDHFGARILAALPESSVGAGARPR